MGPENQVKSPSLGAAQGILLARQHPPVTVRPGKRGRLERIRYRGAGRSALVLWAELCRAAKPQLGRTGELGGPPSLAQDGGQRQPGSSNARRRAGYLGEQNEEVRDH